MKPSILLAAMTLPFALACGDVVVFHGGTGGGGGDGGSGGTGGTCRAWADQEGDVVTVRIVNDSPEDLYVPTQCGLVEPQITPQLGDDGVRYGNDPGGCFFTCEELQRSEPPICTAEACLSSVRRIAPGDSFEIVWEGTGMVNVEMPTSCWFDASWGNGECTQLQEAAAQAYRVEIPAFAECVGDCTCTNGDCIGEPGGAQGYHDTAGFHHPEADPGDGGFGPCAFGCAEGG